MNITEKNHIATTGHTTGTASVTTTVQSRGTHQNYDTQDQVDIITDLCSRISISGFDAPSIFYNTKPPDDETKLLDPFSRFYVFDWDNTLCPTDWFCDLYMRYGLNVFTSKKPCPAISTPHIKSKLNVFETNVRTLLLKCKDRGEVAIMSNATSVGLIKTLRLLPLIHKTLTELKVDVVSARDLCEPQGLPLEKWKDAALIKMVTVFIKRHREQKLSVMTIGDQEFEHIALHNAAAQLLTTLDLECHPKCIKFIDGPSLEALNKQIISFTDLVDRFADDEKGTYMMEQDEVFIRGASPG